nr:DUF2726 domain-containing protein [Polymorphobacter sp.]
MTIEFIVFGAVVFGIACGLLLERMRERLETEAKSPIAPNALQLIPGGASGTLALASPRVPAWFDSAAQLRLVSDARFSSKRLLSVSEARVLDALEVIIADMGQDWRVMAQVNLAEIVASTDLAAISAIDDQRVDMLIVSADQMPIAAVEYQALGQIHEDNAIRDAVKREALRRAGITYIEVRANDTPGSLRADIIRLVAQQSAAPTLPEPEPVIEAAAKKPRQAAPRKPKGKPASGVKP